MTRIELYDATLRDGMGGGGMSLTADEKVRLVHRLDDLGIAPHRGRLPGLQPQGGRALRAARARAARARDDRRLRHDAPARRRGRRGRRPARAGRLLRAGLHDRRQDLDAARREGRARLARGEPRDDRRVRRVPRRAGQARDLRRRARLRRPARRPRLRDRVPARRGRRGRRAARAVRHERAVAAERRSRATSPTSRAALPGVAIGIHCHDDGGCAVANSLMAVEAGRDAGAGHDERHRRAHRQREPHHDHRQPAAEDGPPRRLRRAAAPADRRPRTSPTSCSTASPTPRQPYVGKNAFAHKAGLHAAGIRADATTFEHVDPALVGNRRDLLDLRAVGQGHGRRQGRARRPRARRRRRPRACSSG